MIAFIKNHFANKSGECLERAEKILDDASDTIKEYETYNIQTTHYLCIVTKASFWYQLACHFDRSTPTLWKIKHGRAFHEMLGDRS